MMKKFFQKLNKDQRADVDDLNLEYDEFYGGKTAEDAPETEEKPAAGGYYDAPKTAGGYEEPEYKSDDNRYYEPSSESTATAGGFTRDESYFQPRTTWKEPEPAEPVFTPAPAPEFLYFMPETYGDCREGIVSGLASGQVVIIFLEEMEANDILRLFDYVMGAVQALDAEMLRPIPATVVLIPNGVEVSDEELEEALDVEEVDDDYEDDEEYEDCEEDAEYEDEDVAYEDESDEDAE